MRRGERGFTLLEVMVALAILSLAVVACIQGLAQGLRLLKLSGDHQRAMLLADLKAREVVTLEEGEEQGTEDEFQWQRTTRLLDAPDLVPQSDGQPRWRVWEIDVRVRWDDRRQVEVTTLRTAAATLEEATARGQAPAPGSPVPATSGATPATTGSGGTLPGRRGVPLPGGSGFTSPGSRPAAGSSPR